VQLKSLRVHMHVRACVGLRVHRGLRHPGSFGAHSRHSTTSPSSSPRSHANWSGSSCSRPGSGSSCRGAARDLVNRGASVNAHFKRLWTLNGNGTSQRASSGTLWKHENVCQHIANSIKIASESAIVRAKESCLQSNGSTSAKRAQSKIDLIFTQKRTTLVLNISSIPLSGRGPTETGLTRRTSDDEGIDERAADRDHPGYKQDCCLLKVSRAGLLSPGLFSHKAIWTQQEWDSFAF
jgi:hypothetical protein